MGFLKSLTQAFRRERSVTDLAKWLDLPESELREWLGASQPWARGYDYTRFSIPKRRGGTRPIEAPSDKLKALQRRILHRLLNPLEAHSAATGFARGRSIVDNARPHVGQSAVINIDLADFFSTITIERVAETLRGLGWSVDAATILSRICTHDGRLPQGAPTSPAISNLVCRRLDARLSKLIEKKGGRYTRYADDLTISFSAFGRNKRRRPKPKIKRLFARRPRAASRALLTHVRHIIEDEGFKIQMKKKVRVQRSHQRQTATGLIVNRTVNLPRATRRRIRAMQHYERVGRLDTAGGLRLRGWEALLRMIDRQRGA
jgi:hypothetical protein